MHENEKGGLPVKVLAILSRVLPGIDLSSSDSLVDDGILDSLSVAVIISEISMEFGINIPFEELESRNFNSIDSIVSLIQRCPKRDEPEIL